MDFEFLAGDSLVHEYLEKVKNYNDELKDKYRDWVELHEWVINYRHFYKVSIHELLKSINLKNKCYSEFLLDINDETHPSKNLKSYILNKKLLRFKNNYRLFNTKIKKVSLLRKMTSIVKEYSYHINKIYGFQIKLNSITEKKLNLSVKIIPNKYYESSLINLIKSINDPYNLFKTYDLIIESIFV